MISKIEEERNKVSKLEFTEEKMNSVLSEYDSFSSGYKDAPFLSLAEMLKKAITLFGTNENEINEKKKFLQKLKDFIEQCSKKDRSVFQSAESAPKSFNLSESYLCSKWNWFLHIILSDSYPADFTRGFYFFNEISYSSSIQKYIDRIAPNHCNIRFLNVLSKIKDDMEQNYVKVYSFAELNEFLDVLNSYLDKINRAKKEVEDKEKAAFEAKRAEVQKQQEQELKDDKTRSKVRTGCLVFVLIFVLICVAMCAAGAD